jgi:ATP-dependent protease ClpP protease subunit
MSNALLSGQLTSQKARAFIDEIIIKSENSKTISIQIKSHGGCLRAYTEIANAMHELSKKSIKFIGQADEVGSTALLIYLTCNERLVRPGSQGFIHLPVLKKLSSKSELVIENTISSIISFIERRTGMSNEKIKSLYNIVLSSNEMIDCGIATKKVPSFNLKLAEQ